MRSEGSVLEGNAKDAYIWEFHIGISFSKNFAVGARWTLKPELDLAILPVAGDRQYYTDVRFTGTNTWIDLKDQFLNDITY